MRLVGVPRPTVIGPRGAARKASLSEGGVIRLRRMTEGVMFRFKTTMEESSLRSFPKGDRPLHPVAAKSPTFLELYRINKPLAPRRGASV